MAALNNRIVVHGWVVLSLSIIPPIVIFNYPFTDWFSPFFTLVAMGLLFSLALIAQIVLIITKSRISYCSLLILCSLNYLLVVYFILNKIFPFFA